jgi:hypothetical protein
MKVKTLRMKNGFKEFAILDEEGEIYTCATPELLPDTATMEDLKEYYEMEFPESEINFDNLEIVEFELTEIKK